MYSKLTTLVSALGLYANAVSAQNQGNPIQLPAVTGAGGSNGGSCGGCYVVADVAGIAFGTETIDAVQTNSVIVQNGRNGSTFTTTSIIFNQGQFTVGPTGVAAAPAPTGAANVAYNTDGTTVIVSGVTLTSPTAYNVFTAYSVTSSVSANGACSVVAGPSTNLPSAFSVAIPSGANLASFAVEAERSFISFIGLPSCSPGGENYAATTQIPVNVSTTAVTTTATGRATPMPVSVAASRTGPTSAVTTSFIPFSPIANASRTTFLPNGTGTIVITNRPGATIMPAAGAKMSVVGSLMAGAIALVAGLVA